MKILYKTKQYRFCNTEILPETTGFYINYDCPRRTSKHPELIFHIGRVASATLKSIESFKINGKEYNHLLTDECYGEIIDAIHSELLSDLMVITKIKDEDGRVFFSIQTS